MNIDPEYLLSVSRATLSLPKGKAPDVRFECESPVIPPLRNDFYQKWVECPQGRLFGLQEKSRLSLERTQRPWHVARCRFCRPSALHVCAHAYLTNEILAACVVHCMDMHSSQPT